MAAEFLVLVDGIFNLLGMVQVIADATSADEVASETPALTLEPAARDAYARVLMLVAGYDGIVTQTEAAELQSQVQAYVGSHDLGDVPHSPTEAEAHAFLTDAVAQVPPGQARDTLLHSAAAVALVGDLERQRRPVVMLGQLCGWSEDVVARVIERERAKLA